MKGSITAYSIIELVIAGMVVLIGGFLLSNLFGGLIENDDESIFTIRDLAAFSDSLSKDKCADFDFLIKEGFRMEHISGKLSLIEEGKSDPVNSVSMKKSVRISDNDLFNSINNEFPINIDFTRKIDTRACVCNDGGTIILSKMPYQYGIASGCSIGEAIFG